MDTTAYTAVTRQMALQRRMTIIADNVANMATTGFKAEVVQFEAVFQDVGEPGDVAFVQDRGLVRDLSDGPLVATGNPLDLAIVGDGFFAVETAQGPAYTRDGHFSLNADGEIVNASGQPLLDDGGAALAVAPGGGLLNIAEDGTLSNRDGVIGRVGVVNFADPQAMQRIGSSLLSTEQAPEPVERPVVVQGSLESSNVVAVMEMTALIETSRAFQNTQKMIETHHDLVRRTVEQTIGSDSA